ncbi:MAG: diacylglycerol/polyprenol kinase family protein [Anaerolineae bacterium]
MNNWLGFLLCFIYIFSIIGVAELLRRQRGYSSDFTRKVIHIGVGMLSWALHFLFDTPWFFIAAAVLFMIINFLDWRFGLIKSMASTDQSNLGTVYFPLAAAVVALLLWQQPPLMVAALMPLTWGDGLAPVIGKRWGKRPYTIHTSHRTLEGSAGFAAAAFLFTWLALWFIGGNPAIAPVAALLPALVIALATTAVEAISIWGLDNLTITAVALVIISIWTF